MLLEATPAQLPAGLPVGTQGATHCQWCDYEFYEGDVATVLVSKPADSDHWTVHRAYCAGCDPSAITGPTLGCTELLVTCRLGTQTDLATQETELVVLEPELRDASEPAESQSALETDEDVPPTTQPAETDGVEIETLPPRLNGFDSHRSPMSTPDGADINSSEEQATQTDAD
ncbi:hypothetical protein [Natronococcus occultus]|uniref:DUF8112 domain-containing protein n=1 Tax=Natronococcus occultus SP4 TaxID=694430 RepID=L0JVF9_9EURY|nr:hypothetical protein [Natronococcus occultus]AGB37017.1 hypothetical protein Natoc_1180 [Natronococcus occultus SP4]